MSAANCLIIKISSCEAKVNYESKLSNVCTILDGVVGMLNVTSYNCGTLPSQVPIRKMEHGSTTANINSLLFDTSN